MSDELKIITISGDTLQKMSEEMLKHLRQEEKVQICVVSAGLIPDAEKEKLVMHVENPCAKLGSMGALLLVGSRTTTTIPEAFKATVEAIDNIKPEELDPKVFELHKVPDFTEIESSVLMPQKRQKHYVPRTIGRPCSHKKGGR